VHGLGGCQVQGAGGELELGGWNICWGEALGNEGEAEMWVDGSIEYVLREGLGVG